MVLGGGLSALLVVALYGGTVVELLALWGSDPNYSHGFLVLPVAAWLAWRCARQGPLRGEARPGLGSLEILAGCLLHLAARVLGQPLVDYVGLVLVLRGAALVLGGLAWARRFRFPLAFLFFLFPLPFRWTAAAGLWLMDAVSWSSTAVLECFLVCYRYGNVIRLAGVDEPLVVAEECSGLRQLEAFVACAALVGHLGGRRWPRRLPLLFAAVPLAIGANVVRILAIALVVSAGGAGLLEGWLHHTPALFTLPLGLGLLVLTDRCFVGKPRPDQSEEPTP